MQRVSVGDVTVISVNDMTMGFPGRDVYPEAGDIESRYGQHLDSSGNIMMPMQSFVLVDSDTVVLVDTGFGPEYQGKLLENMEAGGIDRSDVDMVIFTHLHVDHTGWNIDRATGQPNFPNAVYLVPQKDWDFFGNGEHASFERDVRPLKALEKLELFDGEHRLTGSITTVPTPGHTPGHTSVAITSGGEQGLITGDVVLSEIDVEEPTLESMFDENRPLAVRTRVATIDRLAAAGSLVGAGHLPAPGLGHFMKEATRQYWRGIALK